MDNIFKGEVFSKISGISLSAEKFKNDEKKNEQNPTFHSRVMIFQSFGS